MCGLFGVISGQLSTVEVERFMQLGFASATRGIDSTGIIRCIRKGNKTQINTKRGVMNPVSFLTNPDTLSMMHTKNVSMLAGHARAATKGKINITNAHPVTEGRIIGMHNGTIDKFSPGKDEEDSMTDSRLLFRKMNEKGLIPALKEADFGAYALAFVDTDKRTFNLLRNSQRPLYTVYAGGKTTMYWASEERILQFMIDGAANPSIFGKIESINTGWLIQFDLTDYTLHEKTKSLYDELYPPIRTSYPEQVSVPLLPRPKVEKADLSACYCRRCHYNLKLCACSGHVSFTVPKEWQITEDGTRYNPSANEEMTHAHSILDETENYVGYRGKVMTRDEAEELLADSCSFCDHIPHVSENVFWFGEKEYCCADCYVEPVAKDLLHNTSTFKSKYIKTSKMGKA